MLRRYAGVFWIGAAVFGLGTSRLVSAQTENPPDQATTAAEATEQTTTPADQAAESPPERDTAAPLPTQTTPAAIVPPQAPASQQAFDLARELESLQDAMNTPLTVASRYAQTSRSIAAPTMVITEEQIRLRGYRDLKDIFEDLPGFDFSGNVRGEQRSLVLLRGISGNQKLLILQDGQRLSVISGELFVYGNNVPLGHVKRIEVIYGPASAVYGADAYSGVVNLVTKNGEDIEGADVFVGGGMLDRFKGRSWQADTQVIVGKKLDIDSDFLISGRFYTSPFGPDLSKDYLELKPIQYYGAVNPSFKHAEPRQDTDINAKLRLGNFTFGAEYSDTKETAGPSQIADNYLYTKDLYWRQRRSHAFATYLKKTESIESTTTLFYQMYEVDPGSAFLLSTTFQEDPNITGWNGAPIKIPVNAVRFYKYAHSEAVQLEEQLTWFINDKWTLGVGGLAQRVLSLEKTRNFPGTPFDPEEAGIAVDMDAYTDTASGRVFGATLNKAWGLRPQINVGAYAMAEYRPVESVNLSLGGRIDNSSVYGLSANPRAGAVWQVNKPLTLRAFVGSAFIQPSNYDKWENFASTFVMHIPHVNLQPERITSANVGASYRLMENMDVSADVFYNRMTGIIRPILVQNPGILNPFRPPGGANVIETNANQGMQYTYGGELKATYSLPTVRASASYAYLNGWDSDSAFPINKISNHKVLLGVDWYALSWLSVSSNLRWFSGVTMARSNDLYVLRLAQNGGDASKTDNTFGPKLGTWLLDAHLRADIFKGLAATLTLNNLLNQAYYTAAPTSESLRVLPRAPQLRFNWMAGLNYQLKL